MALNTLKRHVYILKQHRTSEQTFKLRITFGIIGILACMLSLTFSTVAMFSNDTTANIQRIQTADYSLMISVVDTSGNLLDAREFSEHKKVYTLIANEEYTVRLTASGTATTGFGKIEIPGYEKSLYTMQIPTQYTDGGQGSITFTIKPTANVDVTFISQWGTYNSDDRDIYNDVKIEIQL